VIPHDREAVDGQAAAQLLGISYKTWRNTGGAERFGLRPFNPGRRKLLFDRAQVEAARAGRELPTWPVGTREHPDDLLDGPEAAAHIGIDYGTLRRYQHEERLAAVEVCGVPHFRRGDLDARRDTPGKPGRPAAART